MLGFFSFFFFIMCVFLCVASTVRGVCFDAVVGFYLENREIRKRMQRGEKRRQLPWAAETTHLHKHTHTHTHAREINMLRDWRLEICRSHTP